MKTGLILEGGGMRGMFTMGVLDVWMEQGIRFDAAIGVSAGAVFGCNYKSGQIGRAIRYNVRFCKDKRYCSLRSLLRTGNLFHADFCYHTVPEQLDLFDDAAFARNPMAFYVVATDLETGEAVYRRIDRIEKDSLEWFRASASMPLVSRPVELEGRKYLDGGIADSIPVRYFESIGYTANVVVLTQPRGYRKSRNRSIPFLRLALGKYPRTVEAMRRRHEVYNGTLDHILQQEATGHCFVVCPDRPLDIGRVERDPDRLRAVYELGRSVGERSLDGVQNFLSRSSAKGEASH